MIKLQKGDYISTRQLTEELYHQVVQKFRDAGCSWPYHYSKSDDWYRGCWDSCGWSLDTDEFDEWNQDFYPYGSRQLTLEDVLGS